MEVIVRMRVLGPRGTQLLREQWTTTRFNRQKIELRTRVRLRAVWSLFDDGLPGKAVFRQVLAQLRQLLPFRD